tara:strand:- start:138 stop:251 length:114 start_codon:yes stop_codon:yes gene_type:complete
MRSRSKLFKGEKFNIGLIKIPEFPGDTKDSKLPENKG